MKRARHQGTPHSEAASKQLYRVPRKNRNVSFASISLRRSHYQQAMDGISISTGTEKKKKKVHQEHGDIKPEPFRSTIFP